MVTNNLKTQNQESLPFLEVLLGVLLIGIIAAVAVPFYLSSQSHAKTLAAKVSLTAVANAIHSGLASGDLQLTGTQPNVTSISSQIGYQTVPKGTLVYLDGEHYCISNGIWVKLSGEDIKQSRIGCQDAYTIGDKG